MNVRQCRRRVGVPWVAVPSCPLILALVTGSAVGCGVSGDTCAGYDRRDDGVEIGSGGEGIFNHASYVGAG